MKEAGAYRRASNLLIDTIVIFLGIKPLVYKTLFSFGILISARPDIDSEFFLVRGSICVLLYYFSLESITGFTFGKLITGTKVVNLDGGTPTTKAIFIRTIIRIVPLEPLSFFGKRGWHDSISKTSVVLSKTPRVREVVLLVSTFLLLSSFHAHKYSSEYDVACIYQGKDYQNKGAKFLTDDGLKEVGIILVPLKLEEGKYIVRVTRKAPDIYKVDDKDIFIQTKYCYEYSYSQEVILTIDGYGSYSIGKIKF